MSKESKNFFWVSYSDLMTSLFFIMLVLYIITLVILLKKQNEYKTNSDEYNKIKQIEKSINNIDNNFFEYNKDYKKHILKIEVKFNPRSSNLDDISNYTQQQLIKAGNSIKDFVLKSSNDSVSYLVIVEGQSSKDNYSKNFELSYERALNLVKLWQNNDIDLYNLENCELLIAGSGVNGHPRNVDETANQRFLIHIIPKVGTIKN